MGEIVTTPESKVPLKIERNRGLILDMTIRLIREKPLGLIGGVIVILLLLTGIFADFLAPYGYNDMILSLRLTPPGSTYLLGGDNMGRDLLSRVIYGARISMIVGLAGASLHPLFFGETEAPSHDGLGLDLHRLLGGGPIPDPSRDVARFYPGCHRGPDDPVLHAGSPPGGLHRDRALQGDPEAADRLQARPEERVCPGPDDHRVPGRFSPGRDGGHRGHLLHPRGGPADLHRDQ